MECNASVAETAPSNAVAGNIPHDLGVYISTVVLIGISGVQRHAATGQRRFGRGP